MIPTRRRPPRSICFHPVAGSEAVATNAWLECAWTPNQFPSRCRERGGCNSAWHLQKSGVKYRFPSRCRERGGCNERRTKHFGVTLSSFHPVAGNEAVATLIGYEAATWGGLFPSRCRERGGCNTSLIISWQWRTICFHPVAGNEAVATRWNSRNRPSRLRVSIPLPGTRRLQL